MTLLHWYALIGVPAILLTMAGAGYAWVVWYTARDDAREDAERARLAATGSRPPA